MEVIQNKKEYMTKVKIKVLKNNAGSINYAVYDDTVIKVLSPAFYHNERKNEELI